MGPIKLERIDEKLDALQDGVVEAMPTRNVSRGYTDINDRPDAELQDGGWINIVSEGEKDYHQGRGMAAKEGTVHVLLICHLKVAEDAESSDLMQAEINLAEDIKSFVRTGVAGMDVILVSVQQSRLLEHPYGWVVAFLELRPPASSVN